MLKKRNIIAVSVCLLSFGLMALGSGSQSSGSKKDITKPKEAVDASVDENLNEDTAETSGNEETKGKTGGLGNEDGQSQASNVTIEKQTLVDRDGIRITAEEYTTDSIWGDGIKLLIENNADKDYTIGCDALIVNDYMISDLFASTVAAGKKATETMYLSSSQLNAAGIKSVGKIEMYFHATDDNLDRLFSKVYSEIKTSEYSNMDTEADDSGTELYNNNGVRIVGKTVDENSFWGTAILLFLENTSGRNVSIHVDDMSVNGFMMTPYFSSTVYDGKKAIEDITLLSSELEENGIDSINEVELKFRITDADTYDTIDESDNISFSAK
ncbi:MAG: hypothetical protein K6G03_10425 [Lachnospiraceae bacterium]|nr:hypothetical protein [Lachnospiraceae bacterium]